MPTPCLPSLTSLRPGCEARSKLQKQGPGRPSVQLQVAVHPLLQGHLSSPDSDVQNAGENGVFASRF